MIPYLFKRNRYALERIALWKSDLHIVGYAQILSTRKIFLLPRELVYQSLRLYCATQSYLNPEDGVVTRHRRYSRLWFLNWEWTIEYLIPWLTEIGRPTVCNFMWVITRRFQMLTMADRKCNTYDLWIEVTFRVFPRYLLKWVNTCKRSLSGTYFSVGKLRPHQY